MKKLRLHRYHLVDPSPWPLLGALSALVTTVGGVMYMHFYKGGGITLAYGLIMVIFTMIVWWRDVIAEATFEGHHTQKVRNGLRYGMFLFIASEVMFFFAFFWAFFHSSLAPAIQIGSIWPPKGISVLDPWGFPFANTAILLCSGVSVTLAHKAILVRYRLTSISALIYTIALGLLFTCFQLFEYMEAKFQINDSVYGATFYMATGFHGFHVIIGTIFLIVCLVRHIKHHFTNRHHFGFEAAAWYWHFVDVVWLFLFVSIYWWGSIRP